MLATMFFLAALPARALDPSLDWSTLETPNFSIHFHQGLEAFAVRTAEVAEEALARLGPFLGTWPRARIEVVVSDSTDSANGSATVYPRALIRLNPTPPDNHSELNDHDDWLWSLMLHELTHVLHLGDIGGLPRAINALIGQQWIPNSWQPNWVVEGFAIQAETRFTSGGRNRSSIYAMQLRLMALEGRLPDLDDISGSPSRWPRGVAPYLAGARFIDWIADRYGPQSLAALSHDYGSAPIPFLLNLSALRVLGKSWIELYRQWQREVSQAAASLREALLAQGLTEVRTITASGERTGSPRFCAPEGEMRVCYIDAPGTRRPSLRSRALDGSAERVHAELYTTGELAISPNGREAIVSQQVTFKTDYSFEDLYRVDLSTGERSRMTFGARASAPDFSPDGRHLAFVQRRRGGTMALVQMDLATRMQKTLVEMPIGEAIFTPRYAPNGRALAYSAQTHRGRDLVLLDLERGTRERLTSGRALDLDPAFDPAGEALYFASDVGGIYDVFRLDLATGEIARLTRLISGAFSPDVSRDGRHLTFVTHSARGADIALVQLAELKPLAPREGELDAAKRPPIASFLRAHASAPIPDKFDRAGQGLHERLVEEGTRLGRAIDADGRGTSIADLGGSGEGNSRGSAAIAPEPEAPSAPEERAAPSTSPVVEGRASAAPAQSRVLGIHPYRPWRSLGARAWLPTLQSDADGNTVGLMTFGDDAVGLHSWTIEAGMGLSSHQPYVSASYAYRGIRPELSLTMASLYARGHFFGAGRAERQWQAHASAFWPVNGPSDSLWFSLGYHLTMHQALARQSIRSGARSLYPDNALLSVIRASVGWSNAWSPAQAISPTEGWSLWLSLNGSHAAIGSALDYATASASITRYLAMPWHDLHVLALRLRGGIGLSSAPSQALFGLGGAGLSNPIADYVQGTSTSNTALRGYRAGAMSGKHFWMASAEYRLPIAILDWGPWTLPLYFKRLHGALTADAGWAGQARMGWRDVRPSIGAVLRLEAIVRHDFGTQVQLGYAYGFGREGIHNVYLGIGSGF